MAADNSPCLARSSQSPYLSSKQNRGEKEVKEDEEEEKMAARAEKRTEKRWETEQWKSGDGAMEESDSVTGSVATSLSLVVMWQEGIHPTSVGYFQHKRGLTIKFPNLLQ